MRRILGVAVLAVWLLPGAAAVASDGADDSFDAASAEKLGHYVRGYNGLIGTFDLATMSRQYAAQRVSTLNANQGVDINDGWIEQGDDELKQGHDEPGGTIGEADAEAGRMIAVLDRLTERLKGLKAYYASRGPLEDGFARGKREDPLVLADYATALAEVRPLGDALDVAIDRRDAAVLVSLKASGDRIGYDGGLAMLKARRLVSLFQSAADTRDQAILAHADALVEALEATLTDLDAQLALAKAAGSDDHALRNSDDRMASERLQTLVGWYREMKHAKNPALHQAMVSAYNAAVDEVNIAP